MSGREESLEHVRSTLSPDRGRGGTEPTGTRRSRRTDEAVDALLTCAICTEPYRLPKVLPCQHTFCLPCLEQYYEAFRQERLTILGQINCPICNMKVVLPRNGMAAFPDDFKIGQIRDFMEKVRIICPNGGVNPVIPCDICRFGESGEEADFYCVQCAKNLCHNCNRKHSRSALFSSHSSIEIAEDNTEALECKEHRQEMKYVCVDCTELSCVVCVLGKHQDHAVRDLTTASELQQKTISELLGQLQEKLMQFRERLEQLRSIQTLQYATFAATQECVRAHSKSIIQHVREAEKQVLGEIESRHIATLELIGSSLEETEVNAGNIDSLCEFAKGMLGSSQSLHLMAMYGHLNGRMQKMNALDCGPLARSMKTVCRFQPTNDIEVGDTIEGLLDGFEDNSVEGSAASSRESTPGKEEEERSDRDDGSDSNGGSASDDEKSECGDKETSGHESGDGDDETTVNSLEEKNEDSYTEKRKKEEKKGDEEETPEKERVSPKREDQSSSKAKSAVDSSLSTKTVDKTSESPFKTAYNSIFNKSADRKPPGKLVSARTLTPASSDPVKAEAKYPWRKPNPAKDTSRETSKLNVQLPARD